MEYIGTDKAILNVPSLAMTPPMGWSTWDGYGTRVSESDVKSIADIIASSGMRELGYEYILIDEGWEYLLANENDSFRQELDGSWIRTSDNMVVRNSDGIIQVDAAKFPNGMAALSEYVHSKGLKLGIYTSPGRTTCFNGMGSLDYEQIDANTYASWGIDAVKYDLCSYPVSDGIYNGWAKMQKCLENTGRDFLFYLCVFAHEEVWKWGAKVGHYWRICHDTNHQWSGQASWGGCSVMDAYEAAMAKINYTGPNGWNDVDTISLMTNIKTYDEKYSQMAIWCFLNLPIILGGLTTNMTTQILDNIIKNSYLLSINRDSTNTVKRIEIETDIDMLIKPLQYGVAVLVLNKTSNNYTYNSDMMDVLGTYKGNHYHIYDVNNNGEDLGEIGTNIEFTLSQHSSAIFIVK